MFIYNANYLLLFYVFVKSSPGGESYVDSTTGLGSCTIGGSDLSILQSLGKNIHFSTHTQSNLHAHTHLQTHFYAHSTTTKKVLSLSLSLTHTQTK